MSVSSLERKLEDLKKAKKRLNPSGKRSNEVKSCIGKLEGAFSSYIRSDNVDVREVITDPLHIVIEEHGDFTAAVGYIDRAIRATQEAIEREKEAERARKAEEG